jgi:hypothetical protein
MHAFYTKLFSLQTQQTPRLRMLARLTRLSRADLKALASDLDWNVWH